MDGAGEFIAKWRVEEEREAEASLSTANVAVKSEVAWNRDQRPLHDRLCPRLY